MFSWLTAISHKQGPCYCSYKLEAGIDGLSLYLRRLCAVLCGGLARKYCTCNLIPAYLPSQAINQTQHPSQRLCFNLNMKPRMYSKEKVREVQAVASAGKPEMGRRPRGTEADRFHRGSVLTPRTPPAPALPAELRMETARMATGRRVSPSRLMLRIKQTKEMDNPIVPHSLAQPNISKSDCLALLQSKTWCNQISPYLHRDL